MSMTPLFKCDNCGDLDYVLFDGYGFGDRMLEGVIFKGFKSGKVEITEDSKSYFEDLNKRKWLKEAKEYLAELDCAQCPTCGDDCDVFEQ